MDIIISEKKKATADTNFEIMLTRILKSRSALKMKRPSGENSYIRQWHRNN